jgi:catechol 2,3-dioxygenase-like lactoylglutathione lyase family enzyme
MSLAGNSPIGFIPTRDRKKARTFYEGTLGLPFVKDDGFAAIFRVGPGPGIMLRVVGVGDFTPLAFTLFGWEVDDLPATIDGLISNGVSFQRFGFLEQDTRGIWKAPNGDTIAWFKDPDGNTLSLSHHL